MVNIVCWPNHLITRGHCHCLSYKFCTDLPAVSRLEKYFLTLETKANISWARSPGGCCYYCAKSQLLFLGQLSIINYSRTPVTRRVTFVTFSWHSTPSPELVDEEMENYLIYVSSHLTPHLVSCHNNSVYHSSFKLLLPPVRFTGSKICPKLKHSTFKHKT